MLILQERSTLQNITDEKHDTINFVYVRIYKNVALCAFKGARLIIVFGAGCSKEDDSFFPEQVERDFYLSLLGISFLLQKTFQKNGGAMFSAYVLVVV